MALAAAPAASAGEADANRVVGNAIVIPRPITLPVSNIRAALPACGSSASAADIRPGCSLPRLIFANDAAEGVHRLQGAAALGQLKSAGLPATSTAALSTAAASFAAALRSARLTDPCTASRSAATASASYKQAANTASAGLAAKQRALLSTAAEEDPVRDARAADLNYARRGVLTAAAQAAELTAGLQAACRALGTTQVKVRGRVASIDDSERTITLVDGRSFVLPQRADTIGRISPGQDVSLSVYPSVKPGSPGWVTTADASEPASSTPSKTQVACIRPMIVPVQNKMKTPTIVHSPTGYRDPGGTKYLLENGMRIKAQVTSGCDGSQGRYSLRITRGDKLIASSLGGASSPVRFAEDDEALQTTLTIDTQFTPRLGTGVMGRTKVLSTTTWPVKIAQAGVGFIWLKSSMFSADYAYSDQTNSILGAALTGRTEPVPVADAWVQTPSGPAVKTIGKSTPFLMRPQANYSSWAPFTPESTGMGSNALRFPRSSGLRYPHVTGTSNGFPYRYTARLGTSVITDLMSVCGSASLCSHRLPWLNNTSVKVSQGNGPGFSHNGAQEYAFDFGMTLGSIQVATRPGIVGDVVETNTMTANPCADNDGDGDKGDEDDKQVDAPTNYLRIDHQDGSYSYYAHIAPNSVLPEVGDTVARGQAVALTGNIGRSCGPHLHYQTSWQTANNIYGQTTPMNFKVKKDDVVLESYRPVKGDLLVAVP